jgi:two-component system, NtrC family, nitrogen regulation sensor histidine kinase NtrY
LFLHEVAHPAVTFTLDAPDGPMMVCDRRQLGQALTNLVKNAVEAIEAQGEGAQGAQGAQGAVVLSLTLHDNGIIAIDVADSGVGLPKDRERIVEPYMTTRARGTGLGLAIVKKIVEEHFGAMSFADRPGGGTIVSLCFDPALLEPLIGRDADVAEDAVPAELVRKENA